MKRPNLFLFTLQTFRAIMVSYALVVLVPLGISLLIYLASVSMISRETERANAKSLMLLRQMVDSKLRELSLSADQLSLNAKVQSAAMARAPVSPYLRYDMTEVQTLLQQAKLVNSFIEGAYLFLPNTGYVLSNVSRYRGDEFALTARSAFGMSQQEWERTMLGGGYRRVFALPSGQPAGQPSDQAAANPTLVFTQKLNHEEAERASAVLVFKIDGRNLSSILEDLKWDPRTSLAISLPEGVFRSGMAAGAPPSWLEYESVPISYSASERALGGVGHVVAGMASGVLDLRYSSLIPSNIYRRSVTFISWVMAGYVLVCLSAGLGLSYLMAKRNYTPIRRLTGMFLEKLGGDERGAEAGFPYLEEALQRLLKQNEDLEETLHSQSETIRSSLLSRLLRSHPSQIEGMLASCRDSGFEFPTENYLLMAAAYLDKPGDDDSKCIGPGSDESRPVFPGSAGADAGALIGYMLQHALEELAGARHVAYATELGGLAICMICLRTERSADPGWEETMEWVADIAEKARALFRDRFGIGLSFAVSSVRERLNTIPLSIGEIDRLLESIGVFEMRDATVFADSVDLGDPAKPAGSSLILYRSVAEKAYSGDFTAASGIVASYLEAGIGGESLPLQTAKLRMYGVMSTVSEILRELQPSLEPGFLADLDPVDRLYHAKSVQELRRHVDEIFARLDAHAKARKEETSVNLKDMVADFVRGHFKDPALSVNLLADRFGVSVPHLSRTFKRDAGIGLLEYIHILRVREATRLMSDETLRVGEVARKVGYGSRVTLSRALRKFSGLAPTTIRNLD